MILLLCGSGCLIGGMHLIDLATVIIEPALHTYSSLHFQLRHGEVDVTMGRLESCCKAIMSAIWSQTLKSGFLGSLSNVFPLSEE